MRNIEMRISSDDNSDLLKELNLLENHAEKVSVPLSYTDELYALRNNINLVREKLLNKHAAPQ